MDLYGCLSAAKHAFNLALSRVWHLMGTHPMQAQIHPFTLVPCKGSAASQGTQVYIGRCSQASRRSLHKEQAGQIMDSIANSAAVSLLCYLRRHGRWAVVIVYNHRRLVQKVQSIQLFAVK